MKFRRAAPARALLVSPMLLAAAAGPAAPPLVLADPADARVRLVDVREHVPDAVLDLRYATTNNVANTVLYDAAVCLVLPETGAALARAAATLRTQGYRLYIWDCYRPLAVQHVLFRHVPVPGLMAPPSTGSHHNRGAAVDLSLADLAGNPHVMPTDFDAFGEDARRDAPLADAAVLARRRALQAAMRGAGFATIRLEWWHFHLGDASRHPLLDIPLSRFVARAGPGAPHAAP